MSQDAVCANRLNCTGTNNRRMVVHLRIGLG